MVHSFWGYPANSDNTILYRYPSNKNTEEFIHTIVNCRVYPTIPLVISHGTKYILFMVYIIYHYIHMQFANG